MDALVDFTSLLKTYPRNNKLKFDNRINHWLPLVPSQKLAGLVADLMADGHLQGDPKWRFDYCSNSRCELNRFEKTIAELFGLKGKIRDCTTNQYNTKNYGVNYRPLAKSLFLIGVPCGNKVMKKYSIPTWILNDKKLFASFVRRYFDCEAGIDVAGKSIAVELHKSVDLTDSGTFFLNQMRRGLLNYFGIKSTVPFLLSRKNKRKCGAVVQGIRLKVRGKDNLSRFYGFVGFDSAKKMRKLKLTIA